MKIPSVIFFLLLILLLLANLKLHKSYIMQSYLLPDFNNQSFNFKEKIIDMDYQFPDISVTSMNISDMIARYYIKDREYEKAMDLINESNYDPLGLGESLKAQIYLSQNKLDSFIITTNRALNKLPLNTSHMLYQMKSLSLQKDYNGMRDTYLKIKNRTRFFNNDYFYLVTAYSFKDKLGDSLIKDTKEILYKYKNSEYDNLKTICYYILYGEDNYKMFLKNFENGTKAFREKNFSKASKLFEKSHELFPINFESYENEIISNYNQKNFKSVVNTYSLIPDSINPKKGKLEYIVSQAYFKLENKELGCKLLNISKNLGFSSGSSIKENNCND